MACHVSAAVHSLLLHRARPAGPGSDPRSPIGRRRPSLPAATQIHRRPSLPPPPPPSLVAGADSRRLAASVAGSSPPRPETDGSRPDPHLRGLLCSSPTASRRCRLAVDLGRRRPCLLGSHRDRGRRAPPPPPRMGRSSKAQHCRPSFPQPAPGLLSSRRRQGPAPPWPPRPAGPKPVVREHPAPHFFSFCCWACPDSVRFMFFFLQIGRAHV